MYSFSISNIAWSSKYDDYVYSILNEYGFEGLEIAPTRIFSDLPYSRLDEAKKWSDMIFNKYNLHVSSMQSIWYGRKEKLFRSKEEREILTKYTMDAILFAEVIGCRNLVFGCPSNRIRYTEYDTDIAIDFFSLLGEYALKHNTVISLEANPTIYNTDFVNTTKEAVDLIRRIDSSGIRLNLDVGTMIYNNESAEDLNDSVELINHIHISEPCLKVIQKRAIHDNLNGIIFGKYEKYISIEMNNECGLDTIKKTLEYIRNTFK